MELDVIGAGIEAEQRERAQAAPQRVHVGADEDEVEVWDANVVSPYVDLLHTPRSPPMALELARPAAHACHGGELPEIRDPSTSPVPEGRARGLRMQSPRADDRERSSPLTASSSP